MSFDAFANFGDIKGQSTDKEHKDWVVIESYVDAITRASAEGNDEVAVRAEFSITKLVDAASPKLFEATCKGTHLPEVTIDLVHPGPPPFKYLEIKLKEVVVTGISHNSNTSGDAKFPAETINLTFGRIEFTYTKQKPDGTSGGNVAAKWNLVQGVAA